MQFKLHFDQEINPYLYKDYCEFIFDEVKDSVKELIDPRKYKVRQQAVLESSVIKWTKVPKTISLVYYMTHCLELVKIKSEYVIRVNPKMTLPYSRTKVSLLIRLLEYGNEKIPPLPLLRRVMDYYAKNYQTLFDLFLERKMTQ